MLVTCSSSCRRRSQRRSSLRTLASSAPKGSSSSSTLRLDGKRAGERDALPLAAGELVRIAVRQPVELHQLAAAPCTFSRIVRLARAAAGAASPAGRRRRSRTPSCAGTARSAGTRSRPAARARRAPRRPRHGTGCAPASGTSSPAMIRSSVVLPQPDGPSSATSSPDAELQADVVQRGEVAEALADVADFDAHDGRSVGRSCGGLLLPGLPLHQGLEEPA